MTTIGSRAGRPPGRVRLAGGLGLLAALALVPRLWQLGAADLSQAEHHKLEAAAAWLGGHFVVDGEHPALFKALVTGSVALFGADSWALRLPNAFAGAGIAVLVALLGRRLVDPLTGWLAGGLMALGTLPVAIDRVGKEDTLMLALALAAALVWLHAEDRPELWLAVAVLTGAAAAAKYEALPLLPALFLASRFGLGPPLPGGRRLAQLTAAFVAAHLVLNPLLLLPEQWAFLFDFVGNLIQGAPPSDGSIVPTTGFGAAGELYPDKPVWYYALYLALKSQLVWIAAAATGLALALWRRRRGDTLVVLWVLGYLAAISVVPFGFARYLAPALPALALLGGIAGATLVRRRHAAVAAAGVGLGALALTVPLAQALPYPTLFVNAAGGGSGRALYWTPDDAGGNLGMRAAVDILMAHPVAGRVAVADPTLVAFLSDGRLAAVAVEGLSPEPAALRAAGVRAMVVQPSQRRLGNAPLFDRLARSAPRWTISVRGLEMVGIHLVGPDGRTGTAPAGGPIRLDVTVR